MTIDSELVGRVDKRAKQLGTTRSAFAREALRAALDRYDEAESEKLHIAGYRKLPTTRREFSVPEKELAWGDEPWSD